MKLLLSVASFVCIFSAAQAQSFTGYNTGNYAGVSGVFFNPAYAANSRYRWDFNLFQINASVSNDAASYKLSTVANSFSNNEITNKLYSSRNANAQANADILGHSLLFNINSKTAFAFTTRVRVLSNLRNVDGGLLQAIKGEDAPASYAIANNNMQVAATGWMEAGVTWANVLYNKGNNFLKGGISLKYLGGIANASISNRNINGTINLDNTKNNYYAANASGDIDIDVAGASVNNFSARDLFKFNGTGAGADIGITYEYRDKEKYKLADGSYDVSANMYKVRASLALLDAGSTRFAKDPQRSGNYSANIAGSSQFYLDELNTDLDSISATFARNGALFTRNAGDNNNHYKVSLPTALMAEADYHFNKGFYVNVATHLSLAGKGDVHQMSGLTSVAITPRLETPAFGLYLPLQVNNISGFNAGVGLRLGPLVVGSANIFTALGGSKMADFYFGVRLIGGKYKH